MKDKLILFPNIKEPQPGDLFRAKDGNWYFCVLGTDCYDCDIDCEDTSKCEYRSLCSCFKRKEFSSVVFRYVRNLPEIIEQLMGEEKKEMNTSNDKEQFSTGAVRDKADDKPRPELISPFATDRLAQWLRLGAEKYAPRNWEKGIPISRCFASLHRHLMRYQEGDRSEDHLAAAYCNLMFCLHFEEMVKRGVLPASLLDMPLYQNVSYTDK